MWLNKKTEVGVCNLIICMSGSKTCFHDVDFIIPKYLLTWENNIISEILFELVSTVEFSNNPLLANIRDIYLKVMLLKAINKIGQDFGHNAR